MEILASGGRAGKITVWDIASGDIVATLEEQATPVDSLCFSPCGSLLVSGSSDVIVWDCETWTKIQIFTVPVVAFNSVRFNGSGDKIVSISDNTVHVWSLETNMEQLKIEIRCENMFCACFNCIGGIIAVTVDTEVRLYDAETGELKKSLIGHSDTVFSVDFNQDDSMLVSGSDDNLVILWDVASGSVLRELRGHTKGVTRVCFNGECSRILSGSIDETARIWDVSTGECLLVVHEPRINIFTCCFSENGNKVITGCEDGKIIVWDSYTGEKLKTLSNRTGKSVYALSYRPNVVGSYI